MCSDPLGSTGPEDRIGLVWSGPDRSGLGGPGAEQTLTGGFYLLLESALVSLARARGHESRIKPGSSQVKVWFKSG